MEDSNIFKELFEQYNVTNFQMGMYSAKLWIGDKKEPYLVRWVTTRLETFTNTEKALLNWLKTDLELMRRK